MSWRSKTYDELPALAVRGPVLRANLRVITIAWMYGIVWAVCIGGSHVYKFGRIIGFNDFDFGLMAAIPCLATLAQLVAATIIERTGLRKHQFLACGVIYRLLWIPMGLIPLLLVLPSRIAVYSVLVLLAAAWLLASLASPAWTNWMGDLIPRRIRGRYFALRGRLSQLVSIFAVIAVSLLMIYNWEFWRAAASVLPLHLADTPAVRERMLLYSIAGVFCIGAIFGSIDTLRFTCIREVLPPRRATDARGTPVRRPSFVAIRGLRLVRAMHRFHARTRPGAFTSSCEAHLASFKRPIPRSAWPAPGRRPD